VLDPEGEGSMNFETPVTILQWQKTLIFNSTAVKTSNLA